MQGQQRSIDATLRLHIDEIRDLLSSIISLLPEPGFPSDEPENSRGNHAKQRDPLMTRKSCSGLLELIQTLSQRFDDLGHLEDIKNAIRCGRLIIQIAPEIEGLEPGPLLSTLGELYIMRCRRFGQPDDLNKAIGCYTRAVISAADDDEDKPDWLNSLGMAYMCRSVCLKTIVDVDRAIECHAQAVQLTSHGHVDHPERLYGLGNSYLVRSQCFGKTLDAGEAIECYTRAVQLAPGGHPSKPGWLANLGVVYMRRFEHNKDPANVDNAIECRLQAVQLTPDGHEDKIARLGDLGFAYRARFEHHGDIADIDRTIECHVQASQLARDEGEITASELGNFGTAYRVRFERYGGVTDIDQAIKCHMQALQLTPDDHADRALRFNDLGDSYACRFQRHDDVSDADNAIRFNLQAIQLTPDGYPLKPRWLGDLGTSYLSRFQHNSNVADLDNGVDYHAQAVQLTPDGHAEKPLRLGNLGSAYMYRFQHHGYLADLNYGIKCHMEAVQLVPDSHADKPKWLNNLGKSLSCRFGSHGDVADLDNAIKYHRQAVQLVPDDYAGKPSLLMDLGNMYLEQCEQHALSFKLDLQHGPDYHAHILENLYSGRYELHTCLRDIEDAVASFERAAQSVIGDPHIRFNAARKWAFYSPIILIPPLLAYQRTMELIPQLVWLGTTIKQRYALLPEIGNVVTQAACWAITVEAYDYALEWLEQGRSVVWNQILQLRTPFDSIYATNPQLAKRLKEVALELEHAGSRSLISLPTNNILTSEKDAQQHRHLAAEWDRLLEQAREVPGFKDFMGPRKAAELMGAAKNGPIIVVNVHVIHCDALIIQPNNNRISRVSLDDFSLLKAVEFHRQFMFLIASRSGRDRGFRRALPVDEHSRFKTILGSLWSHVVKPIFDFLGYNHRASLEELPHVTWCTTGPLSFLPLHAAGCYDGSQPNALDLAVSSYIPTLSALLSSSPPTPIRSSGILAVGQQYTKGHSDLPYTAQELAVIEEHADEIGYLRLDNESATVGAVLSAMENYSCVHLACHATQHQEDPAQSAFHLHDGDLTLATILQRSFKNKGLAFLSACQTAAGDEKLPDEAVHLAAGMLMAGYPSVIATMWSIQDADAPEVARQVYGDLVKDGEMDCTTAARALHKAVLGLRERVGEESFERWLPFIHIGF